MALLSRAACSFWLSSLSPLMHLMIGVLQYVVMPILPISSLILPGARRRVMVLLSGPIAMLPTHARKSALLFPRLGTWLMMHDLNSLHDFGCFLHIPNHSVVFDVILSQHLLHHQLGIRVHYQLFYPHFIRNLEAMY